MEMSCDNATSRFYSITSFIDALPEKYHLQGIEIWIDTTMYPNNFGINVRPIQVIIKRQYRKTIMDMNDIIKCFNDEIPYIRINETKYRHLTREPSVVVVNNLTKKEYEEHLFYDYHISKLFLQDELREYHKVHEHAMSVIKEHVQQQANEVLPNETEIA